jgi:hypothetical protein
MVAVLVVIGLVVMVTVLVVIGLVVIVGLVVAVLIVVAVVVVGARQLQLQVQVEFEIVEFMNCAVAKFPTANKTTAKIIIFTVIYRINEQSL